MLIDEDISASRRLDPLRVRTGASRVMQPTLIPRRGVRPRRPKMAARRVVSLAYGNIRRVVRPASARSVASGAACSDVSSGGFPVPWVQHTWGRHSRGGPLPSTLTTLFAGAVSATALTVAACDGDGTKAPPAAEGGTGIDRAVAREAQHSLRLLTDVETVIVRYENGLRGNASDEKAFKHFATVAKDDEELMTVRGFVHSFTPCYVDKDHAPINIPIPKLTAAEEAALAKETPELFRFGDDSNPAGLISYSRYLALLTLLAIPRTRVELAFFMFDTDGSGEIDADEFSHMLQTNIISAGDYDADEADEALLQFLFGADLKGALGIDEFRTFVLDLQTTVNRLAFDLHQPRPEDDTISARDLALSIATHASAQHIGGLLRSVNDLSYSEDFDGVRISFEDFDALLEMVKRVDEMEMVVRLYSNSRGAFSRVDLVRSALAVGDIRLSDAVVDVLFFLFDRRNSGELDRTTFIDVMRNWQYLKFHKRVGQTVGDLARCVGDCCVNWYQGVGGMD